MRSKAFNLLRSTFAAALLAAMVGSWERPVVAQEGVVPVRKVTMPDGGHSFALPVRVGSTTLEYRSLGQPSHIGFVSGTELDGVRAQADVGFGDRHGRSV